MTSESTEMAKGLIAALDGLAPAAEHIARLLRSYIQDDELGDVCAAREAARDLQRSTRVIVAGLWELADQADSNRDGEASLPCAVGEAA